MSERGHSRPAAAEAAAPLPDLADDRLGGLARLDGRSLVLVGLMGSGKTTIGRRLALRLALPFIDADTEIERAACCTIAELFERFGEAEFRLGERRVLARLLAGPQAVIATGGGAVTDADTRRLIRERAVSAWLRCRLPLLVRRVSGRSHRPLLAGVDPAVTLGRLLAEREPLYAEADLTIDCGDDGPDRTTAIVLRALSRSRDLRRVRVPLSERAYDVVIGEGLLPRAGALLGRVLPQRRVVVVTDENVATRHLPPLMASFAQSGIEARAVTMPSGERSKSIEQYATLADAILASGVERQTAIVALGGGVIGDLAGFAAATIMRGLPFVQIPTTLLAQVDSSVGGKVGINTGSGKNLLGAFHQPLAVLADTAVLATLPLRERRAGYAEIVKAGLIADRDLFAWCERNGGGVVGGDPALLAEAVARACAFKTAVVLDDEREERAEGGRALLNLGHTFGHALERALGYDGRLLHGEAVAVGCGLAFLLSARLGHAPLADWERVVRHLASVGLPARLRDLPARFSADSIVANMARDKKMRDGVLGFVLARGIGDAFTDRAVPAEAVRAVLIQEGCAFGS